MQHEIQWKHRKVAQCAYNPNLRRGALPLATSSVPPNANSRSRKGPCKERQGKAVGTCVHILALNPLGRRNHPSEQQMTNKNKNECVFKGEKTKHHAPYLRQKAEKPGTQKKLNTSKSRMHVYKKQNTRGKV